MSKDSGYDSSAESVSSSEVVHAVNRLVQEDLGDGPLILPLYSNLMQRREQCVNGLCCSGSCKPCLFHKAWMGCPRGAKCIYCHECDIDADRIPQRPRKTLRHKIKRNVEELLQRFDTSPERVHDQLQSMASSSHYAANFLAGGMKGVQNICS